MVEVEAEVGAEVEAEEVQIQMPTIRHSHSLAATLANMQA